MEDDVVAVAAELAHDLAVLELQLDSGHAAQPASKLQRIGLGLGLGLGLG